MYEPRQLCGFEKTSGFVARRHRIPFCFQWIYIKAHESPHSARERQQADALRAMVLSAAAVLSHSVNLPYLLWRAAEGRLPPVATAYWLEHREDNTGRFFFLLARCHEDDDGGLDATLRDLDQIGVWFSRYRARRCLRTKTRVTRYWDV